MYAKDFEYDGHHLSDYGFIICTITGNTDIETINAGSKLAFNVVKRYNGKSYGLASTSYEECVSSTFEICKNPCLYDDIAITNDEYRDIMRWLNRREFLNFQIVNDDDAGLYDDPCIFKASFNIDKITYNGILYGLMLTLTTDKPFGYGDVIQQTFQFQNSSTVKKYVDISDEIGYTYPNLKITINQSGNLTLTNQTQNCSMIIKNCTQGEVITIDGETHIITSSRTTHKIYNDFNFTFFKIGNDYDDRTNVITASLPCTVVMSYYPIVKDIPN